MNEKVLPIPELRNVNSAITYDNHEEHLKVGSIVYIVIDFIKYIVYCPAHVRAVYLEDELDGVIKDVKVMLTLKGYDFTHCYSLAELNGHSAKMGDELPSMNYSRIFHSGERAMEYAKSIEWIRLVQLDSQLRFLSQGKNIPPRDML